MGDINLERWKKSFALFGEESDDDDDDSSADTSDDEYKDMGSDSEQRGKGGGDSSSRFDLTDLKNRFVTGNWATEKGRSAKLKGGLQVGWSSLTVHRVVLHLVVVFLGEV